MKQLTTLAFALALTVASALTINQLADNALGVLVSPASRSDR